VSRKRVSVIGMKIPARAHTEIFSEDGKELIGEITSGGFSPTLNKPIAMGYGLQNTLHCIYEIVYVLDSFIAHG
jgi:glycine cleavage system aminomethyltransferase T